jgi:hypothetical protein
MMGSPQDVVWITWESQPRNQSMARELGATLFEVVRRGPRPLRYWRCAWATVRILLRTRPRVVFVPNPSFVLTYVMLVMRGILGFRLAIDAHYGGIIAVNGRPSLQRLLDRANRSADAVIVTNEEHARVVRKLGGTAVVCPDPLPELPAPTPGWAPPGAASKTVLFICSFDPDEPYRAVFDAARTLREQGFQIFVSGNYHKAGIQPADVPQVSLLGYVARDVYCQYLHYADVVLDLTDFPDCLVCGAYEGIVARKPCVLSATAALQAYFTHGTVFTSHEPGAIARAVIKAYEQRGVLSADIAQWTPHSRADIARRVVTVRQALGLAPVSGLLPGVRPDANHAEVDAARPAGVGARQKLVDTDLTG